ncbi:MAG: stage III sporulation protein AC [Bacillota bacterium]|nr:stage III sporulation protein AC [Bacillota bacterium]
MEIDIIFKIAGVGMLVAILCIVLRKMDREEMAQLLTLVGVVVVLSMVIKLITDLFSSVRVMFRL